ncbi:MAG: maltose ABC transporter substrate-binding protein [Chloroflexi bacterium]|nr:MAG: maltose ABC transporter substrate-binding protein [Chloroflexota bacterium]
MIRRNWLVLVVVLLAAAILAACGGRAEPTATPVPEPTKAEPTPTPVPKPTDTPVPQPTPTPEEVAEPTPTPLVRAEADLVIWADSVRAPALEPIVESFQDEYGVTVAIQEVGFGDIRDGVKLAAPAGEGPDIFIGPHDWLGELYVNGLVAPIDLGDKQDNFFGPALQAFTYNGELVGMPYATENVAFFYNPELVPEPPTTWDEVIAIADELETAGKVQQGWVLHENDPYHFFPIQTAFGGYIFGLTPEGYDPNDVGLDSEGSLAAAQFLDQAIKDGHLRAGVDWDTMHVLFESGDAAMFITGPWALSRIRESGIPYAIAPIPGQVEEAKPFIGVQGFMINAFSENKLLAEAFLTEFVATDEVMQAIFEADPRPSAWLPVREATEDPDLAAFAAAGKNGLPMPAIPEMSAVWGAWGDAITLIFQQAEDPVTAFKNAAEQVRAAIAGG